MASINYAAKEISVKIVYYGPGLSGKTTNLQVIHRKTPPQSRSDMVSLATETDRTLFFDFLPIDLGTIKGFSTKFQLYTVPGQVYYNATRKLVLRGVDGIVFVADSAADKMAENIESFQNLEDNLAEYGYKRENIPIVLQYNKRDLPNALPVEELDRQFNKYHLPWNEAIAPKGKGVFESLKMIGKLVIDNLNRKYNTQNIGSPLGARVGLGQAPIQQAGAQRPTAPMPVTPGVQPAAAAPIGPGPMPAAAAPRPHVPPVQQPRPQPAPQPIAPAMGGDEITFEPAAPQQPQFQPQQWQQPPQQPQFQPQQWQQPPQQPQFQPQQWQQPPQQPQFQPQQWQQPPQQPQFQAQQWQQAGQQQGQQPQAAAPEAETAGDGDAFDDTMYFTSVNTDRPRKKAKRPVNPKTAQGKGFLGKLFGKGG